MQIQKHFRLIEAIGLFIAMLAWTLEWRSVRFYDSELSNARNEIIPAMQAYTRERLIAEIMLGDTSTRGFVYKQFSDLDKKSEKKPMRIWTEEVRMAWTKNIIVEQDKGSALLQIVKKGKLKGVWSTQFTK